MATSGSISTNSYSGRYLVLNWSRTGYDISGNYSNIHWELKGAGNASASWYMAGNFKVVIDGVQRYYSSNRIKLYNGTLVASGDIQIGHNADGTRSFSASIEAGIYTVAVNCSASGSWSIDTIPRYLNSINIYNNGSALNSISVKWTCDPQRDWTQYSLNGGSWTDAGDSVASDNKSGTFSIGGLAQNT